MVDAKTEAVLRGLFNEFSLDEIANMLNETGKKVEKEKAEAAAKEKAEKIKLDKLSKLRDKAANALAIYYANLYYDAPTKEQYEKLNTQILKTFKDAEELTNKISKLDMKSTKSSKDLFDFLFDTMM